ncbi:hybrid sensor histidine kinase/response regulator [Flavobacterium psychrotrophum]|uniref:hybrid sensor histidine kinase/response regulator n=1 Tax=Flavobacterium psychrotrophum TaxID=2294119 RepID=UPI000E32418E|nr:response regulator [Flavobacterium psychrotrophum]
MILIVDDQRENIMPLKKILEIHGLQADSAESGEEALIKILKVNYSLIILDVQMPGMDGFEVMEIMAGSSRTKDIPVIFLSAINKEKKYISRGYETGAVDYITKPVDPDFLILKVKTFLKLYEQKQELRSIRDILSKEVEIRKEAQDNLEAKVAERTAELVAKNDELEMRNHELQQFSWVVSHDLKEPLRKIEMFSKIIKERYINSEDGVNYVDRTIRSAERMSRLITDLLDYSRLSSNVAPEMCNLNKIIAEVTTDFDYLIEEKDATVKAGNLATINGVYTQLRQLFQNLIGNSLKFAKNSEPPVVEINGEYVNEKSFDSAAVQEGTFYRITVKDNGIGFDEKYLDRIFIIFQSLNDRQSYEGTGIGLAIAKKIIEKHNGIITAKSSLEKGASFIMVFPV